MRRSSVGPLRWDFQLRYWKHFRFIPVIIPFTQPDHHISSFVRDRFSNGVLDRMFPTDYNDLLFFQVESHWSDLRCQGRSIITMEKLLIRSYFLPVSWTLIRKRAIPSSVR